mmetsp:Transcript_12368/g.28138  ORF Transcript_12368/g.28138 Transcript_12368/m.28138 type:complete len:247 (+) Transcript_12368:291-1031(+)
MAAAPMASRKWFCTSSHFILNRSLPLSLFLSLSCSFLSIPVLVPACLSHSLHDTHWHTRTALCGSGARLVQGAPERDPQPGRPAGGRRVVGPWQGPGPRPGDKVLQLLAQVPPARHQDHGGGHPHQGGRPPHRRVRLHRAQPRHHQGARAHPELAGLQRRPLCRQQLPLGCGGGADPGKGAARDLHRAATEGRPERGGLRQGNGRLRQGPPGQVPQEVLRQHRPARALLHQNRRKNELVKTCQLSL